MSLYSLSQRTINTVVNTPAWEIRSASTDKPRLIEMGISQNTATSGEYGLGRPGQIGLVPTTPQNFVTESDSGASASLSTGAVAWGTAPTSPTYFNRRAMPNAAIGAGVIWSFPRGFDIPQTSSLVIWIATAAPVCDVWAVVDE